MNMRGCSRRGLLVWLGVWPIAALTPRAATSQTRLVVVAGELPPYVSAKPEDSFLTDLLAEIAQQMKLSIELRFMPWKRGELAVETHEAWATVPYVPTEEREKKFLFSEPLYFKRTSFFYYSEQGPRPLNYNTLSDLRSLRIGAVSGYFYQAMLAQAGLQVDYAASEEMNFRKLQAGRIDLAPAVDEVGFKMVKRLFPPEQARHFYLLERPLHVGANYLMSARSHPGAEALLARFNEALLAVRSSGAYKAIADRHGLAETASAPPPEPGTVSRPRG